LPSKAIPSRLPPLISNTKVTPFSHASGPPQTSTYQDEYAEPAGAVPNSYFVRRGLACHSRPMCADAPGKTERERCNPKHPLLAARHSLLLARLLVVERRYSEAIPPLLTTAEALAFFQELEIGRYGGHAGIAGDVRQEILNYANDIEIDTTMPSATLTHGWIRLGSGHLGKHLASERWPNSVR
jgi:hypothetical protein